MGENEDMAAPGAPAPFEMVRRALPPALRGIVLRISGYRELRPGLQAQREAAVLAVPLIISLGSPFRIRLDAPPKAGDSQPSFAAGLHAGSVHITSDGRAECVQVDFTPLGARRLFGGALPALASRMVDIEAVFGSAGARLREALGETADWQRRFDLVEAFVTARLGHAVSPEIAFAYRRLAGSAGAVPIAALAETIGWSRKHLTARFSGELGLAPKPVARMMRFNAACRLAISREAAGWADVAAAAGYADQAHLAREFAALAGEPPTAWARRVALTGHALVSDEVGSPTGSALR